MSSTCFQEFEEEDETNEKLEEEENEEEDDDDDLEGGIRRVKWKAKNMNARIRTLKASIYQTQSSFFQISKEITELEKK